MSRLVISGRGAQRLSLVEGYGTVPGIVTLIAEGAEGGHAVLSLDSSDMSAIAAFVNEYYGVTPGGDASSEQDTAAAEGDPT